MDCSDSSDFDSVAIVDFEEVATEIKFSYVKLFCKLKLTLNFYDFVIVIASKQI